MPKYLQLSRLLEHRIREGAWPDGRMPGVRDLAEEHRVSVLTASRALQVLQGKGLIRAVERSGCFLLPDNAPPTERWGLFLRVSPGAWQPASSSVVRCGFDTLAGKKESVFESIAFDLAVASRDELSRQIRACRQAGLGGVFFLPSRLSSELAAQDERFVAACDAENWPLILLDRNLRGADRPLSHDLICSDHVLGGRLCTEHLLQSGRRRIACIIGSPTSSHIDREAGYHYALAAAGRAEGKRIEPLVFELPSAMPGRESFGWLADQLITHGADGVLCYQDYTAVGLILELLRRGVAVPDSIAVVGCDNLPIGNSFSVGVTTYDYPSEELARQAVIRMRQRVAQPSLAPVKIAIPGDLILRESTISPGFFGMKETRPSGVVLVGQAMTAAFLGYFCVYAYRKPFTAAAFEGRHFLASVELKTALVVAQLLGYVLSKYLGVRICSEAGPTRRGVLLVGLIGFAEASLALFAVLPDRWKVLALFLNGLPLGVVWGLIVRYLEGRRATDILLAGLSCSYILASGVVKDIGRWLLHAHGISEDWMPFFVGLLALPVFLFAVYLLERLPPPDAADVALRGTRHSMNWHDRRQFLQRHASGLLPLIVLYCLLTGYRDFRDNYGVEIFRSLGYATTPALFTLAEMPVACGVLLGMALITLLPTNRWGLLGLYAILTAAVLGVGIATLAWQTGRMGGITWMIAVGLGSYLAYVPFGAVLFDRLMAATKASGTAVFAVALADAAGYTVAAGIQLHKDLLHPRLDHLAYFVGLSYLVSVPGVLLLGWSAADFLRRTAPAPPR